MGFVCLAESIEPCLAHHLHPRGYLLVAEGMALPEEMLVIAGAVDKHGFAIEIEAAVLGVYLRGVALQRCLPLSQHGPGERADAVRGSHVVDGLAIALQYGRKGIEIGVFLAPEVHIRHLGLLTNHLRLACSERNLFALPEDSLATAQGKLAHQFYGLCLVRIVLHLCIYKDAVACHIVPYVYAERLYAHLVGRYQRHGAEDAKGLAALGESPLGGTSAARPRVGGLHGRMVYLYRQLVGSITQGTCHVEGVAGTPYQFFGEVLAVEGHRGIGSYTFKLQEIAFALFLAGSKRFLIAGSAVQVAVLELAIAVIVVQIVGHIHAEGAHLAGYRFLRGRPELHAPVLVKALHRAFALLLGSGETNVRTPHRHTRGYGYAALARPVDGTVEMVYHATVFQHIALVGKHIVIGLGGVYQVGAVPVLPVDEVAAHGKGIVGIVGTVGAIGREVEHHVKGRCLLSASLLLSGKGSGEFYDLCITGNDAGSLMEEHGVSDRVLGAAKGQAFP